MSLAPVPSAGASALMWRQTSTIAIAPASPRLDRVCNPGTNNLAPSGRVWLVGSELPMNDDIPEEVEFLPADAVSPDGLVPAERAFCCLKDVEENRGEVLAEVA